MSKNSGKMDWKEELEYSKDGVRGIHGHVLGFKFCRGWNASDPESPKTLRLVITEHDKHGLVKPCKVMDFHTRMLKNLQIILPDDVPFLREFAKCGLEWADKLEADFKRQAKEMKTCNNTEAGVVA